MDKPTRLVTRSDDPAGESGGSMAPEEGSPARRFHARAVSAVDEFFEAARRRSREPEVLADAAARLRDVADEMADHVQDSQALVALAMEPYPRELDAVVPHSVNVAVLGGRVSVGAGLSEERARTICRAGLAHDVGAVELDEGAFDPTCDPESGEPAVLREAAARSREILEEVGPPFAGVARMAHQVYERMDGSGHPQGLAGDDLLLESRVLGAVNFLDAAVQRGLVGGENESLRVQRLVKMSRSFGEDVLKGVVRGIGLFPAGTLVRLSSGEVAQVRENRPDNPMRPLVEVLDVAEGSASGRSRTIDLVRTPHVYVSGALSAAEVEEETGPRRKRSSRRPPGSRRR